MATRRWPPTSSSCAGSSRELADVERRPRGGRGGLARDRGARAVSRRTGPPVRIGLTGPIGCGKSTVAGWLAEPRRRSSSTPTPSPARSRAPGRPGHDAVLAHFGEAVRAPDGTLDRAALGRIVFADPAALRELESIVHPLVRPRILAAIEAAVARRRAGGRHRGDQARRGRPRRAVRRGLAGDLRRAARAPRRARDGPRGRGPPDRRAGRPGGAGPGAPGPSSSRSTRRAASPRPRLGSPASGSGSSGTDGGS